MLTHTFHIDYYSELEDKRYKGQFTSKKLTVKDIGKIGVRRSQLCGGIKFDPKSPEGLDSETYGINNIIAHLEVCLVETPEWWELDEILDAGLLTEVWEEVGSFEVNFRGDKSGSSGAKGSEKKKADADSSRSAPEMVVGEVSSSLEP